MSRARITLRITIALCIVLVTVATAVTLLSLDYAAARESVEDFSGVLLDTLATLVGEKSDGFLGPVERAAQLSGELTESAGASPARFDDIERSWYSLFLAALRCRAAIASLPRAGKLYTRFGVQHQRGHDRQLLELAIGSPTRSSATGSTSRIEGANKEYGTQILISEATAERAKREVLCRHIDRVAVKGKSLATNVFEPLCQHAAATAAERALVREYETALGHYLAGEFARAARLFFALGEHFAADGPTATMLRRCQRLVERPPPSPWRAIHELNSK